MNCYSIDEKALIVIDLQQDVHNPDYPLFHLEDLIEKVNHRIALYREKDQPIIFIQHNETQALIKGFRGWQLFSALDARETDFYVDKIYSNSFYQTSFQQVLKEVERT